MNEFNTFITFSFHAFKKQSITDIYMRTKIILNYF